MTAMPTKESIIQAAEERHAQYPQYQNYWRGSEWKLVRINRDITTGLGHAFDAGEVTIARFDAEDKYNDGAPRGWTAYSLKNECNTFVPFDDVTELETIVAVGRFTYDPMTNEVSGPATYMREQGLDRLRRIESGSDIVFQVAMERHGDIGRAMLVSLQTDYAAWHGMQTFLRR